MDWMLDRRCVLNGFSGGRTLRSCVLNGFSGGRTLREIGLGGFTGMMRGRMWRRLNGDGFK